MVLSKPFQQLVIAKLLMSKREERGRGGREGRREIWGERYGEREGERQTECEDREEFSSPMPSTIP